VASSFSSSISLASSTLATSPQPPAQQQTQVVQTGQVIAATQVAAQTVAAKSDKDRAVQVPKRTEAAFAPKSTQKKPKKQAPIEKREERDPTASNDRLNIVA
jgi:hypothetical protein